jgi:hypothetical protein
MSHLQWQSRQGNAYKSWNKIDVRLKLKIATLWWIMWSGTA